MRVRYVRLGMVLLACMGAVALGASFSWTGNGATIDWDDSGNWVSGAGGFPDDCGDDAIRLGSNDPMDPDLIDLVTEQIDDLTVDGHVDFGNAMAGPVTLNLDSLTITGEAVVRISGGATIHAGACFSP